MRKKIQQMWPTAEATNKENPPGCTQNYGYGLYTEFKDKTTTPIGISFIPFFRNASTTRIGVKTRVSQAALHCREAPLFSLSLQTVTNTYVIQRHHLTPSNNINVVRTDQSMCLQLDGWVLIHSNIFVSASRKDLAIKPWDTIGLDSCICTPTEVARSRWDLQSVTKFENQLNLMMWKGVSFAFILKVDIPYFCLNRADGASHFETERKHRLKEEESLIIVNLCFCNSKKSQWLLGPSPLKKNLNTDQNSKVNYF